jgi:TrmH family RNA methyltransferase
VPHVAVALGNEGAGVSAQVASRASHCVGIPLAAGAESLNVAVTAGILLYMLRSR